MNNTLREKAEEEAILNLYSYIADNSLPENGKKFGEIIDELSSCIDISPEDIKRLEIIKNAIISKRELKHTKLIDYIYSQRGMTCFCFEKPNGEISVVFKGTGKGEWQDNGEGLSGQPAQNTYIYYNKAGEPVKKEIINDFATKRQAEALNCFNRLSAKHGWSELSGITVSGHSKGGNKAQFITINSPLPDICITFNGQGFSPEAIKMFKNKYLDEYYKRIKKISNISADNDYINVLGKSVVPNQNNFYVTCQNGLHSLEAILTDYGNLRKENGQGKLSHIARNLSDKLMFMPPSLRQYATTGVMNIYQKIADSDGLNIDAIIKNITIN